MKITNDTTAFQAAELMGSEADERDGLIMLGILSRDGVTDTDDLTEDQWLALVDEVARTRRDEDGEPKTYRIENTTTGTVLGLFNADSPEAALDAMAQDAGYRNYAEAQEVAPSDESEIAVTEVDMTPMNVTEIQLFGNDEDRPEDWSANIAINGQWMIQRGTDGEYSIPHANLACWSSEHEAVQDWAHGNLNPADVAALLGLDELLEQAKTDRSNWI